MEMVKTGESIMKTILHPVRMRIIQTFVVSGHQTAQQISELIPEVPQATMYRHLKALLQAGVVNIIEEKPNRGTVEKVYALAEKMPGGAEEFLKASKEEHFQFFLSYMLNLMGEFERYIGQKEWDLVKDGAGYSQACLYGTDEEFNEMFKEIGDSIGKLLKNKPSPERKLKTLATIVIPGIKEEN